MIPVFVRIVASYTIDTYPGVTHSAMHEFVDLAPGFGISQNLISAYNQMDDAEIHVTHSDLPIPIQDQITHHLLSAWEH